MIVLAIETATIEVGVALAAPGGLLAEVRARPGRRHVETLHPALVEACRLADVSLAEVGAIAVDVGPGLFTGLRVGVAAAKGLAYGLGTGVVGCSSLEVLAAGSAIGPTRPVVPVVDVRRGEVAWALPVPSGGRAPGKDASGDLSAGAGLAGAGLGPPRLGGVGELRAALDAFVATLAPGAGVLLVGDGARRYAGELVAEQVSVAGDDHAAPRAAVLAELAVARGGAVDPVLVLPRYLRGADAEINWTTRAGAVPAYDA